MNAVFYMDAVITPHRSLSRKGFIALIAAMTAINCITAMVFVVMGAAPVPVFLGLDLLAVVIAFYASYRAAERSERVQVTAEQVKVTREWKGGEQTLWVSPTAFTGVVLEGEAEDQDDLKLRLSGKEMAVARFLSPAERADFAKALDRAIWRAKRGQ